jgi:hypothetical protein
MIGRDEAEWDAEIEAEFQRVVAGTKAVGRRKRGQRRVGFPLAFMVDVCRLTERRTAFIVAALVYRRTVVCNSRTVTLPKIDLAELGINRSMKQRALARLAAAGLVQIEPPTSGRTTRVTLLWRGR